MYRLYSHNDLDGVGCGVVAKIAFSEQVDVRYNSVSGLDVQVGRFLDKGRKDDVVFITDLSVNEDNERRIDTYVQDGGNIQLIDHHKTALHFNEYDWGSVQVEYEDGRLASATSLFYDHLIETNQLEPTPTLDQFVELVRQYDTWEWDKNENIKAKRLNDLFFLLSIDEFEERMIDRIKNTQEFSFDEFETKLLDLEEGKIERYVRKKRRELVQTFIGDYCVGIVHAESYHSELGNELGKANDHLDYIAIVSVGGKRMSLRTVHDEVDVSQIAGQFGGGGHAKASGCSLTEEAYKCYVAEPFAIEPLRIDAFRNRYNLKEAKQGCLYDNQQEDEFFIYPMAEDEWTIDYNDDQIEKSFSSFAEAERYIKRNYAASLVRDEIFIQFLKDHVMRQKVLAHQ
ncbi:DHH family phosphoesterase [Desertibacillus haloalkaliphilus]|uniref:DHH family phosphoesterase n=1 Tax=Desertibacillus haloalkaliphilus TaxID=1328930 RepID=UPI001C25A8A8|nr:oligoribonuclease [Desertibacillus haloalkaliphilus]MBU8907963.1 oligoribonuclease [Desertibacillus haloalkaliphilus]